MTEVIIRGILQQLAATGNIADVIIVRMRLYAKDMGITLDRAVCTR